MFFAPVLAGSRKPQFGLTVD